MRNNKRGAAVRTGASPGRRIRLSLLATLVVLAAGTLTFAAPAQADENTVWEQVEALADNDGAIAAFEDPNIGPVIIFPKDYTGDIDHLQPPANWTDSSGHTPTSWPTPTTAKSANFTTDDISTLISAVYATVQPEGDLTYELFVTYDGPTDRVVAQTNASSSVTDPLANANSGRLVIDRTTSGQPEVAKCNPAHGPLTSGFLSDPLTQLAELANFNCALSYFEDPVIGPVIIFPKDYTGDIDNLPHPTDWTDGGGQAPSGWPTATTAHSLQFTTAKLKEVSEAVYARLTPNGDNTYNTFVYYDGESDRLVVLTAAPSSLTNPLLSDYPDMLTIKPSPSNNVRLINVNSGKALNAANCGTADGTGINQWAQLDNTCQQWQFAPTADGHYTITNVNSGKSLEDLHCGTWNGALMDLATPVDNDCQKWDFAEVDGHYTITSVKSGLAVDVQNCSTNDGALVRQWTPLSNVCQQWDIVLADA
ncbi:RICIN domain-containing protein [Streptomyces sp. ME02-8801-2C]|uniref:RICIN domain-containing protein n=1 Tax=Streptomyces sp. ME02-8801-2C TaxID=3028680 RepID=UPI0029A5061D|nr:RICIN domain-containing protein [Streptomyces sp. ME02-8801-2C]MDX3452087.1 RICIN domain-containing protein [Streptomyces sp. ME02-8801-2C]